MSFGVTLLATMKAIPKLVEAINGLSVAMKYAADKRTDRKFEELKAEVQQKVRRLQNATTNSERATLARELNILVSS